MSIGWLTDRADADKYFYEERLETSAWDAADDLMKSKVLLNAYNRLRFCREFTIPAAPTVAQAERLRMAQCETAYYLAMHLADEDRRKGLQAQGVTDAGIVKESYAESYLSRIPLPAIVYELLDEFGIEEIPFYAADIDRDEDKGVNEDVTDF